MGYNELIFNSLAERKAIFIEGVGVISVVQKGSSKVNPKRGDEFPHFELLLTDGDCDISLKNSFNGDYEAWLNNVCKRTSKSLKLTIDGCFILTVRNNKTFTFKVSEELNMQLNPFADGKKKSRTPIIALILFIIVTGVTSGYYFIGNNLIECLLPSCKKEPVVKLNVIPDIKFKGDCSIVLDSSTNNVNIVDSIEVDSVKRVDSVTVVTELPQPKEVTKANGYTEQIMGNSYIVVGSFKTFAVALRDARRIESLYSGLTVKTTKKIKGNYINYIYTNTSLEKSQEVLVELSLKYDKLVGMWIYEMQ